ncbi:MAG: HTH-type transcriptional regulator hmrR [Frankiales bacterium]|nr:HTH-type transcriptional regulator hmrR [Frankiales bacterium]
MHPIPSALMEEPLSHRQLAAQTYNETWTLLEAARSPAEDLDLLGHAFASRYHWSIAGGAQEKAIADWMASRCCAAVGAGDLAVRFADSALALAPADAAHWLLASLHEGRARAAAAAGDAAGRSSHIALAQAALDAETDAEDRDAIASQLADVPFA